MPGKAMTYKKEFEAITKKVHIMAMKTYKEAYKDADKSKYKTFADFEKAAKAYNTKKYGTTEPTKVAKEKGISKAELAKTKSDTKIKVEPKKAVKIDTTPKAPKAKTTMQKAEDAIKAGDAKGAKQAIKDSDMKGKVKRKVKRVAAQEARKTKRQTKKNERVDKKIEKLEAKKSPMARYGGGETPAAYFKQKIKYNNSAKGIAIRVAADEKDKKNASKAGKKRLDKDISSMINDTAANMKDTMAMNYKTNTMRYDKTNSMRYDKTNSMRYDTNAKRYGDSMAKAHHGMAKKMHGMPKMKTNQDGGGYAAKNMSAPGKQLKKLGSILSKHFKKTR